MAETPSSTTPSMPPAGTQPEAKAMPGQPGATAPAMTVDAMLQLLRGKARTDYQTGERQVQFTEAEVEAMTTALEALHPALGQAAEKK